MTLDESIKVWREGPLLTPVSRTLLFVPATRKAMVRGKEVPLERVERVIVLLRGHRVMLDTDLAALYEVPIKRLNEQVARNLERFPADFMFQLTVDEAVRLRSQIATLKTTARGQHGFSTGSTH